MQGQAVFNYDLMTFLQVIKTGVGQSFISAYEESNEDVVSRQFYDVEKYKVGAAPSALCVISNQKIRIDKEQKAKTFYELKVVF
jgi:hypothetical protein